MKSPARIASAPNGHALPSCTDDQLMARIQADDPDALGQLYDRYFDRAYRLSMSVCHNRCRAEDAVQEAFVSIWRSRATYHRNRGTAASWLLTVVRHRAIDVGRRDDKHATRCVGDDPLPSFSSRDDVAAEAAEMDDAGRLRGLLARLPDAQREVITLAFYGQLTHVEIAERLDLPPGTVKGRMRLGMEKLRRSITKDASC